MLSIAKSFALNGLDGYPVNVEVDLHHALPGFVIVGLGDTAVKESHERVRSAIKNSGFAYPMMKVVANLSPADVKKEGTHFDLPLAVAVLSASEQLDYETFRDFVLLGELSLDGSLQAVNGILPLLISMRQRGFKKAVIPKGNEAEAAYVSDMEIYAMESLRGAVSFFKGETEARPVARREWHTSAAEESSGNIKEMWDMIIDAVMKDPTKVLLESLCSFYSDIEESGFTEETYQSFAAAMASAEETFDDAAATQSSIDTATAELAVAGRKLAPVKQSGSGDGLLDAEGRETLYTAAKTGSIVLGFVAVATAAFAAVKVAKRMKKSHRES